MIKLAITGSLGRMGQRIVALAADDSDFQIVTLLERADHPDLGKQFGDIQVTDDPQELQNADTLIDFTSVTSTLQNVEICQENGIAMVIGTTGITEEQAEKIAAAAEKIPIVFSTNMSIGVNILFKLAEVLAAAAPGTYQVTMNEAHHVHKKDSPSGTAKTLAKIIEQNSDHEVENIDALREGEIIGDHKVTFDSPVDRITIDHHAKTRDIFVKGALVAAKFLQGKKTGLFTMQEVLNLNN